MYGAANDLNHGFCTRGETFQGISLIIVIQSMGYDGFVLRGKVGSLDGRIDANIENVASPNDETPEIRGRISAPVLPGAIKDDVHVTVTIDHLPAVFAIVLKADGDVTVQLSDQ